MPNAIEQFFSRPSKRTYLAARRVAVARLGSSVPVDVFEFQELESLIELGQFAQVLEQVKQLEKRYPLSPRLYFLAGITAEQLGDPARGEFYRSRARCCISGITATGTGQRKSPFQSTYLTDARMIVAVMGREAIRQRVIDDQGTTLDVLECDDGSKLYFRMLQLDAAMPATEPAGSKTVASSGTARARQRRTKSRVATKSKPVINN